MKLSEIKPFVRYSRYVKSRDEYHHFNYPLCACDCRLLYCCDGKGKIIIDNVEYQVSRGPLLLWRTGVPYTYLVEESDDVMVLLGVNFDYTWDHSYISLPLPPKQSKSDEEYVSVEAPFFDDVPKLNDTVVLYKVGESFHRHLTEINTEYEKKKTCFELRCSGILLQLLADVAVLAENGTDASNGERLADDIIDYLNGHFSEDISVNELGALFGYHPNYLNQLFIKYTGKPIYAYLQELRITQAIHLLESSNMSVLEIGVACGFPDRSHFSRYFKQKTGRSPKAFRP